MDDKAFDQMTVSETRGSVVRDIFGLAYGQGKPCCMTCGETLTGTSRSISEFRKTHTEEACPAGEPIIHDPERDTP